MTRFLLVACLVFFAAGTSAAPGDDEVTRSDLQRAQERIAEAKKKIESSRTALSRGQQELRRAEQAAGEIAASLRKMKSRERELARSLANVQAESNALVQRIDAQKQALARDARNAWLLGREQQLRLWLNADDPQAVARIARYYQYIEKDRARRLEEYHSARAALAETQARVLAEQSRLEVARTELQSRERDMATARESRRKAVAALSSELHSQQDELASRTADAAALKRLFSNVREAFRDLPPEAVGAPLAKRKGKLRWPVAGRIVARFGSPVAEGKLTLNGIVIAAGEGSEVRAVHGGRVVFAEWLRGYGQLLILDHGNGYLSAYGHNQSLVRAVGDAVKEGETLATVGASGGRSSPGLYFEIRQGGEPQDPTRWLRK